MSELHKTLLGCGFRYLALNQRKTVDAFARIPSTCLIYIKDYETSEGIFTIALVFSDDYHTTLPWAQVVKKPEHIAQILLPHINSGGYLCYVEEKEADWNPNNLNALYRAVDEQIHKTLNIAIGSLQNGEVDHAEFEGEFVSYWKPEKIVYILSDYQSLNGNESYLTNSKYINNSNEIELTIHGDKDKHIQHKWVNQRGLSQVSSRKLSTVILKVRPERLSGIQWPPQNTVQLFQWLSQVDHNAKATLVRYFVETPTKDHLILLEIDKQDTFGVLLKLNQKAVQFSTYANHKKTGKAGRKLNLDRASSLLMGRKAFLEFQRISFQKADQETILTRNRSKPEIGDLRSKNIALIGCGTVGGYAAELLIRAGAGMGSKKFDLYDMDEFEPHNFSRHTLTSYDFGKNKAAAMKKRLDDSTHLITNIQAYTTRFLFLPNKLSQYDIIVDATGRAPVSKRLAYLVRQMTGLKKPTIIHGYNDGNGAASKVFIDNLDGCYNCLCGNTTFYHNGNDKRFESLDKVNEKKISCGNTYTPYDAAVSIMTAALIQEAVLSTLEKIQDWNYKEHIFIGGRTKKPTLIRKQTFCEICNDR
ncbi:ThiF family adenylyltransferase [Providencia rettgeri]|nr:ThiF family adenylyltransferase [Providencia rettgeri]